MIHQVAGIATQLFRSELPSQPPPQTAADLTREQRAGRELLPPVQTSSDAAAQGGVQRRSGRPEGREHAAEPAAARTEDDAEAPTLLADAVHARGHEAGGGGDTGEGGGAGSGARTLAEAWEAAGPAVMPARGGEVAGVFFVADVILKAQNCYSASAHLAGDFPATGGLLDITQ